MKKCYRCNKRISEKEWKKLKRVRIVKNCFGVFEVRKHYCGYEIMVKKEEKK